MVFKEKISFKYDSIYFLDGFICHVDLNSGFFTKNDFWINTMLLPKKK